MFVYNLKCGTAYHSTKEHEQQGKNNVKVANSTFARLRIELAISKPHALQCSVGAILADCKAQSTPAFSVLFGVTIVIQQCSLVESNSVVYKKSMKEGGCDGIRFLKVVQCAV